jgi:predicted MFS family arabinose efflux permease
VSLILGVPAGTYLAFTSHWTMPFWAVAAGSLLVAALIRGHLPVMPSSGAVPLKERLAFLRRPAILSTLFTTLLWAVAIFSVYTYIADLYGGFGAEGGAISLVLLVGGIGSFTGVCLGGYATDRLGSSGTIVLALTVLAVSLASISALYAAPGFRGAWGAALAAVALYGIGSYSFNPAQQHRIIGQSGPSAGIVLSLNASAIYLGSAGGAFMGGLVLKYGSAAMLGYFGSAWSLAALAFFGLGRLSGSVVQNGQMPDGKRRPAGRRRRVLK